MKYPEYLQSAKKHAEACLSLFSSYSLKSEKKDTESSVWLELYYLSGYIVEGVTVFLAYKQGNWPVDKDIRKCPSIEFINTMTI